MISRVIIERGQRGEGLGALTSHLAARFATDDEEDRRWRTRQVPAHTLFRGVRVLKEEAERARFPVMSALVDSTGRPHTRD